MEPNIDWTGIPHTDADANVIAHRTVMNVLAIEVEQASIRNALVSGVFELDDGLQLSMHADGLARVVVKCLWYGRKPPTSWMHLTLHGKWKLRKDHSGQVVADIGGGARR